MGRRYLVPGGAGSVRSNFILRIPVCETDVTVTNLDAMTCAAVSAMVAEPNELAFDADRVLISGLLR